MGRAWKKGVSGEVWMGGRKILSGVLRVLWRFGIGNDMSGIQYDTVARTRAKHSLAF
jgi:hypothetical protein